ncbi:MAG TPA: hypothetical protein VMP11_00325 [Verrucomicrobiae bacterium]|nr:hypothetical protein [Verrucomicrobiae bacterium]
MGATKRDFSGVFDAELSPRRSHNAAVLDKVFNLSPKGITFQTDTFMPEWMEVGVEMRLPHSGARRDQRLEIGCRGVVVQCSRRTQGKGFEVVLMFLDLPKRAQARLSVAPSALAPHSISISR